MIALLTTLVHALGAPTFKLCLRNVNTDASTFGASHIIVRVAYTRNGGFTSATKTFTSTTFGSSSATLGPGAQSCALSITDVSLSAETYTSFAVSIGFNDNAQDPSAGLPSANVAWKHSSIEMITGSGVYLSNSATRYLTPSGAQFASGASVSSSASPTNFWALDNDPPPYWATVRTYWNSPPGCYVSFTDGPASPSTAFWDRDGSTAGGVGAYGMAIERAAMTTPGAILPNSNANTCPSFSPTAVNCWMKQGTANSFAPGSVSESAAVLSSNWPSARHFCYRIKAQDDYGAVTYSSISVPAFGSATCCTPPTPLPTSAPIVVPSTASPTSAPMSAATEAPTHAPSSTPTSAPHLVASTASPTSAPTNAQTSTPTNTPTSKLGTTNPTVSPTPHQLRH